MPLPALATEYSSLLASWAIMSLPPVNATPARRAAEVSPCVVTPGPPGPPLSTFGLMMVLAALAPPDDEIFADLGE